MKKMIKKKVHLILLYGNRQIWESNGTHLGVKEDQDGIQNVVS